MIPNWQFTFFSVLMMLRALTVLYCFVIREVPTRRAPFYQIAIAWISTFLPVLMTWQVGYGQTEQIGRVFAICGMLLFIFTCLDLGKSFGVSPAVRAPISSGVYRFISHPMYLSHILVETGVLIAAPTAWNFTIVVIAWIFYAIRAFWEGDLIRSSKIDLKLIRTT